MIVGFSVRNQHRAFRKHVLVSITKVVRSYVLFVYLDAFVPDASAFAGWRALGGLAGLSMMES